MADEVCLHREGVRLDPNNEYSLVAFDLSLNSHPEMSRGLPGSVVQGTGAKPATPSLTRMEDADAPGPRPRQPEVRGSSHSQVVDPAHIAATAVERAFSEVLSLAWCPGITSKFMIDRAARLRRDTSSDRRRRQ